MTNLNGRKIIITGASQGLGAVMAKAYAERGAQVALLGRQIKKIETLKASLPNSEKHLSIEVDLLDTSKTESTVTGICENFGNIDIVLHSAGGGLGLHSPLLAASDILKLFYLNVVSCSEINRIVVPYMKQNGGGNLVHVGSIASLEAVGSVGYNTSKAALAAYVRSIGRELIADNIIATGILPGGFHAPDNAMDRLLNSKPDVYKKFVEDRLPRKKMGDANELIPMLLLLSSSEASMMAGCLVPIDGAEGKAYQIDSNSVE